MSKCPEAAWNLAITCAEAWQFSVFRLYAATEQTSKFQCKKHKHISEIHLV
jgi:hypothetical protein